MPRQIFHIAVALATDHPHPAKGNVVHLAAAHSGFTFAENLQPQSPRTSEEPPTPFWKKNPESWKALLKTPKHFKEVMGEFKEFLQRFPGSKVAVTSYIDFWHLQRLYDLMRWSNPFGSSPLDIASFDAGVNRLQRPSLSIHPTPLEAAKKRFEFFRTFVPMMRGRRSVDEWASEPPRAWRPNVIRRSNPTPRRTGLPNQPVSPGDTDAFFSTRLQETLVGIQNAAAQQSSLQNQQAQGPSSPLNESMLQEAYERIRGSVGTGLFNQAQTLAFDSEPVWTPPSGNAAFEQGREEGRTSTRPAPVPDWTATDESDTAGGDE